MTIPLDESQQRFCDSRAVRIRLLAPAGSGKTTSLLRRCLELQDREPKKKLRFLVVAFTRSARDELRRKIDTQPEFEAIRTNVRITTLNALGDRLLRSQRTGLKLVTAKDSYRVLNNTLRTIWMQNPMMKELLSSQKELNKFKTKIFDSFDVLKDLGFKHHSKNGSKNLEKEKSRLDELGLLRFFNERFLAVLSEMGLDQPDRTDEYLQFWSDATNFLHQSNFITFTDQKYFALPELVGRSAPQNLRIHHLLVDEFQDINPLDLELIKELVRYNDCTLTVVGDDDQAIYEWRGTSPKFVLYPEKYFESPFETHLLQYNYRSPKNIVEVSSKLIAHNVHRVSKTIVARRQTDAEIQAITFPTYEDCCDFVMELAKEVHVDSQGGRLALIGRKRSQILPFQILLASEQIPFYAKADLNIFLQKSFEELCTILKIATKHQRSKCRTREIVEDSMYLCAKVKRYAPSKDDRDALHKYLSASRPGSLSEAADRIRDFPKPLAKSTSKEPFARAIEAFLASNTVAATLEVLSDQFKGFSKDYGKARSLEDVFYVEPPFFHLADYAQRYADDYDEFLDHLEQAIANLDQPMDETDDTLDSDEELPIQLMTSLRAKGREFDTVVVLDAVDGIWPSRLAIGEQALEEERRLFYVAVTRAMKRLIIVSHDVMLGKTTTPSPYLEEMDLKLERVIIEGAPEVDS